MTTWILLRGLTRESGHWGDFASTLRHGLPTGEADRIEALDLPGNGALHRETSPHRVEDMVAHCHAELARRGIQAPVRLLAMSLGAMVAVAWAATHPAEIAGLVLVNTSLRPFSPFYQRLQPRHYTRLVMLAVVGATPLSWERQILHLTSQTAPEDVLPRWLALRRLHPVSRGNAVRQLWAAARYRAPAQPPASPILLLAGARDGLVSPACSITLARQWHCALRVHPDAGHDLPLDDAAWVTAQVREWTMGQQNASASQAGSSTTFSSR